MFDENRKFKEYFLGGLDEKETEEIELQIISDPDFAETLQFAENELMEDYLDGTLSKSDVRLFQKNFLAAPERQKQLSHLALVKKYARKQERNEIDAAAVSPDASKGGFWERLRKLFFANLNPVNAVAALVIFGGLIGITWGLFFYDGSNDNETASLQKEFIALNKTDLSVQANYQNFSNLSLIAGTSRSSGDGGKNVLIKERLTKNVLLRLALTFDINAAELFRADVLRNQKTILTDDQLRLYKNPNGQEFRLLLPADALTKGEYQIEITGQSSGDVNLTFSFSVQ